MFYSPPYVYRDPEDQFDGRRQECMINGFSWKENHFESENKNASLAILENPRAFASDFKEFNRVIDFFRKAQIDLFGFFGIEYRRWNDSVVDPGSYVLNFKEFTDWLVWAFNQYSISLEDAKKILETDFYWPKPKKLYDSYKTSTFYDEPEYRMNPREILSLQRMIFEKLIDSNGLSSLDATEEFELWMQFSGRGVTQFTDEWAQLLFRRFKKENRSDLVEALFQSKRVWDLQLRHELAIEVVLNHRSSDHSGVLKASLEQKTDHIKAVMREVLEYFPEQSEERVEVADAFAHRIQASVSETDQIMDFVVTSDEISDSRSLTMGFGFGVRLYSQVFAELIDESLEIKLRLFDFLLGHQEEVPEILMKDGNRSSNQTPALDLIRSLVGPHRFKKVFQALSVDARSVLLNPFFEGPQAIHESEEGFDWLVKRLIPSNVEWKDKAISLANGYREGLTRFGQRHQKTLFLSYILAASHKVRSDLSDPLLDRHRKSQRYGFNETIEEEENPLGRILRVIFEANSALNKIGQRVHSSHLFEADVNRSLMQLKEEVRRIYRSTYFAWIEAASSCDSLCERIEIIDTLGNASVKGVLRVKLDGGSESVLHLVRPNALRRGDVFFEIIEYAVRYAVGEGFSDLKVVLPMISRARETFKKEINMDTERVSLKRLAAIYESFEKPIEGYRFITPSQLESAPWLDSERSLLIESIQVQRFSDLDEAEKKPFAKAVAEIEARILLQTHRNAGHEFEFDADRHEGNYLLVKDPDFLKSIGIEQEKAILVIDPGQVSKIQVKHSRLVLDILTLLAALEHQILTREQVRERLPEKFPELLGGNGRLDLSKDQIFLRHLDDGLDQVTSRKPGEILAFIFSNLEGDGYRMRDSVWDFVTALQTNQTWDSVSDGAFSHHLSKGLERNFKRQLTLKERCRGLFEKTRQLFRK